MAFHPPDPQESWCLFNDPGQVLVFARAIAYDPDGFRVGGTVRRMDHAMDENLLKGYSSWMDGWDALERSGAVVGSKAKVEAKGKEWLLKTLLFRKRSGKKRHQWERPRPEAHGKPRLMQMAGQESGDRLPPPIQW